MEPLWIILTILALAFVISFFMSGMEAGVFALSPLRIRQRMRAGDLRARTLHTFLQRPEEFLWTILVGNTLANFLGLGLLFALLDGRLGHHPAWVWPLFTLGVFLFYAGGDLLPKTLFRAFPNRLCLALVKPFRLVHFLLQPLVAPLSWLSRTLLRWTGGRAYVGRLWGSRDELRLLIQESKQELTSEERAMIKRVLDLQNLSVGQITVPLAKTFAVPASTPMSEVLALCRQMNLSRVPVWQEGDKGRRVAGIVSLRTVLYREDLDSRKTAGDYLTPGLYLDVEMRLEEALRRMQRSGQRLAIVLGRGQQEIGIVGLQDILKVMFGEMTL
jgi:CBS domain containing-hemolysin-like protein